MGLGTAKLPTLAQPKGFAMVPKPNVGKPATSVADESYKRYETQKRTDVETRERTRETKEAAICWLNLATTAAQEAGNIIREAFYQPKKVTHKGSVDLVTETDKACEALLKRIIRKEYPNHKFIGEEESSAAGVTPELTDVPTWIIDPVDGTTNFVHGFPFVCVCIGVTLRKQVIAGVVHNPILNETFTASLDGGAFLNGVPISCSSEASIGQCLLATEIGVNRDPSTVKATFGRIEALTAKIRSVRATGSCAMNMCGVAMGRLDAFYEIGFGGPWDCAAAAIIVQEAGGMVLDPAGGAFDLMARRVLCSNAHLGDALARVLATVPDGDTEPHAAGYVPPPPQSVVATEHSGGPSEVTAQAASQPPAAAPTPAAAQRVRLANAIQAKYKFEEAAQESPLVARMRDEAEVSAAAAAEAAAAAAAAAEAAEMAEAEAADARKKEKYGKLPSLHSTPGDAHIKQLNDLIRDAKSQLSLAQDPETQASLSMFIADAERDLAKYESARRKEQLAQRAQRFGVSR